jgi:hypothetical protein
LTAYKTNGISKGLIGDMIFYKIIFRGFGGKDSENNTIKKGALLLPFSNVNPQTHNVRSISDVKYNKGNTDF